jgi:predicted O-linked N-acetylglucosamine transferase (SPINDLY family)
MVTCCTKIQAQTLLMGTSPAESHFFQPTQVIPLFSLNGVELTQMNPSRRAEFLPSSKSIIQPTIPSKTPSCLSLYPFSGLDLVKKHKPQIFRWNLLSEPISEPIAETPYIPQFALSSEEVDSILLAYQSKINNNASMPEFDTVNGRIDLVQEWNKKQLAEHPALESSVLASPTVSQDYLQPQKMLPPEHINGRIDLIAQWFQAQESSKGDSSSFSSTLESLLEDSFFLDLENIVFGDRVQLPFATPIAPASKSPPNLSPSSQLPLPIAPAVPRPNPVQPGGIVSGDNRPLDTGSNAQELLNLVEESQNTSPPQPPSYVPVVPPEKPQLPDSPPKESSVSPLPPNVPKEVGWQILDIIVENLITDAASKYPFLVNTSDLLTINPNEFNPQKANTYVNTRLDLDDFSDVSDTSTEAFSDPVLSNFTVSGYPHHSKALFRLAYLNKVQENFTQAEDYLLEILQKDPNHQIAQYWLIKILESQGQLDRAKTWVKENDIEFLQKLPDYLSHTGGNAYDEANYDLAKSCYHLALELEPNRYQDWFDLALVASKEKKRTEAIRYYQKVLAINPDHDETMVNLGALLIHQGKFTEAIALLEQALKRDEQNSMAYHNLAICCVYQGQLAEAAFYSNQAVQNKPEDPGYHSHLLTILSAMTEIRSEDLAQVSEIWYDNQVIAKGLPRVTQWQNPLDRERPLRVGFVSGDFKRHSVSYFIKPIFEHHHPEQIEIYAYAQVEEPDDLTDTLKNFCDHWRDTVNLEDQEMADQIQQDQIDILVDLSGHTLFNRLSVFGMKPAPIQATYLGYPATTGLPTVDYWITDTQLHPKDTQERAVEEIWRLPRCYISYDPPNSSPPIGPLPQTQLGVITFGSFNASRKLTPQTLKIWSEILKQVPRSRLLLKCSDPRYSPQLMIESFMKLGIDRERLIVYRNSPYQDHLNLYNQVDLHLDPMPYTGCTTTCEALWMGVPTLTLAGQKKMERMSTSILAHTGLEDFISQTPEDYIAKAVEFATNPEYLSLLRQTLRDRLKTSQLLDGIGLTHALETAFRQMWHRYLTTQYL